MSVITDHWFEGVNRDLGHAPNANAADQESACLRAAAWQGLVRLRNVAGDAVDEFGRNGDQRGTVVGTPLEIRRGIGDLLPETQVIW